MDVIARTNKIIKNEHNLAYIYQDDALLPFSHNRGPFSAIVLGVMNQGHISTRIQGTADLV